MTTDSSRQALPEQSRGLHPGRAGAAGREMDREKSVVTASSEYHHSIVTPVSSKSKQRCRERPCTSLGSASNFDYSIYILRYLSLTHYNSMEEESMDTFNPDPHLQVLHPIGHLLPLSSHSTQEWDHLCLPITRPCQFLAHKGGTYGCTRPGPNGSALSSLTSLAHQRYCACVRDPHLPCCQPAPALARGCVKYK